MAKTKRNIGSNKSKPLWRKRQIIMEPELVTAVDQWHGGQDSYSYALSSTGASNLVSLSMIEATIDELARELKGLKGGDKEHLENTIGDLEMLRSYWKESTAKEAGMGLTEDEYEYDRRDYGYDPSEEDME